MTDSRSQSFPATDPTPDVPRGVVNWPRQRQALEQWAHENGIFSDEKGYLSGAISTALQYLDMIAADNADFQKADAVYQRHREALEAIVANPDAEGRHHVECALEALNG